MRTTLALLLASLALGCSGGGRPQTSGGVGRLQVASGEEFTLAPGQVARIDGDGLAVRFEGVPHDSRCPVDVQCITAGNAVVRLRLSDSAGGESTAELNTTVGPKEASHGGYTVRLVVLRPEPTAGIRTRQSSYRAILQATQG